MTEATPYYAGRNASGVYTWQGIPYKSVTTYLGYAPGQYLMSWYGKQAALKCAAHLFQAGELQLGDDGVLDDFCSGLTARSISHEQAVVEIANWRMNMKEAERYRDHRARVGSITHHLIYEWALGKAQVHSEAAIRDYLRYIAINLNLWEREDDPEFKPTNDMIDAVCDTAYAYALSALEWLNKANPRFEMIGQEAMVVRKDHGDGIAYAGTVDAHMTLAEKEYGYSWAEQWPKGECSLWVDFKTSNTLAHRSVQAQVEAYAHCDIIGIVATGEEFDLPKADMIGSLHIGPHGSASQLEDEFGVLESKAKQIGPKLYTYDRSEDTFEAFCGLVRWADYSDSTPRAHQQRKRAEPKPAARGRYEPRSCPI